MPNWVFWIFAVDFGARYIRMRILIQHVLQNCLVFYQYIVNILLNDNDKKKSKQNLEYLNNNLSYENFNFYFMNNNFK